MYVQGDEELTMAMQAKSWSSIVVDGVASLGAGPIATEREAAHDGPVRARGRATHATDQRGAPVQ